MRDFSIDSASEKIYSAKTKEYFEEVIKSYYNESYRSAIVMLHSIIIVDLLFKLEDLKEIYEDEKAIQILKEITELQEKNPTSPDWEKKLIEFVHKRTNLFEPQDYLHFVAIQQHRHLCAHPIL
ncbi:MAG: hypothetical protein HQ521_07245, partial [Bacteroidetes bacterium]|nr:hypothetical protein [Bacteroidota bacterium]